MVAILTGRDADGGPMLTGANADGEIAILTGSHHWL